MPQTTRRKIFILATIYYGICGVSAILLPSAWYSVAGIEAPNTNLVLMVAGTLFTSLAVGSWLAKDDSALQRLVSIMILTASALDLLVVVIAVFNKELALPQGLAFILLDLFWCAAPAIILKSLAKQGS